MNTPSRTSAPNWWRWLSSPSLPTHAARYAGVLVAVNLLAWLLVGLSGGNIFDRRLPVVLFPVAGFVIWAGLAMFRRRRDTEMGFGRGLRLGALIAAGSSLGLGLLLGAIVLIGGEGLRQRHVRTTLELLATQQQHLETLPDGKALYAQQVAAARHLSAGAVLTDEVLRRFIPAILAALLGAILLRKANPEGAEPERAPRPPKDDSAQPNAPNR